MFHFYKTFLNLFNISSLFSGGIIITSTGSCFSILSSFDLVTAYEILFPKYSPALWISFLEASTQPANIPGPQDVPPTSPSNVRRTSPQGPI